MITRAWFVSRAKIYAAMFLAALAVLFILFVTDAIWRHVYAQDHHELHHAQYQNWNSTLGYGCCNDKDCGTLPESRVRENGAHIEVLVLDSRGDQWCPIEAGHLIDQTRGKRPSPDWSVDHACILSQDTFPNTTACDRLKCFMEKGRF